MKKSIITFILLVAFLLIFGCSRGPVRGLGSVMGGYSQSSQFTRSESAIMYDADYRYGSAEAPMVEMLSEDSGSSEMGSVSDMERKLIKRANIRIRVDNLETADASISALMTQYDAYAASTYIEENSRNYSLRVPALEYDAFLKEMDGMGRMLSRSENTEDVTLRYYDLEGRLDMKKELLKTFQSYLGKANNIEEIMSVEARIAELQNDIEGTGMQLRHLANRVDYATIDLNLLGPVVAMSNQNTTFGERIKELLGRFGYFLSTVVVVLTGIVIYGIPILLLVIFFFWILFGRIGLFKKLWRIVMGKNRG